MKSTAIRWNTRKYVIVFLGETELTDFIDLDSCTGWSMALNDSWKKCKYYSYYYAEHTICQQKFAIISKNE